MEVKQSSRERKVPGGIALRPSLWARVDALAEAHGKSRNQVMEETLSLHLPIANDLRKSQAETRGTEADSVEFK